MSPSDYTEELLVEQPRLNSLRNWVGRWCRRNCFDAMSTRRPSSQTIALPPGYAPLLADLKARVRAAQVRAVLSVNRELILLYWHIGGRDPALPA